MFNFKYQHLEGKLFNLGSQDCFTVVTDFFWDNFQIKINNFARPNDWNPEEDNLIEEYYKLTDFKKLDKEENWPPRPADILVCTVGGSVPNHLVIFLGGNTIIHHKVGMISSSEIMRPAWRRYCSYILRHPDIPHYEEEKPTATLMEAYRENSI